MASMKGAPSPVRAVVAFAAVGTVVLTFAASAGAVCPGGGGGQPPSDGNSIRFGTFNTAFVSNALGISGGVGKGLGGCPTDMWGDQDFECRTRKMIPKIIASNYDVIVLNEVFDEDARELLVDGLRSTFPYFISKLDNNDLDNDSGLMLFSKWPFDGLVQADVPCLLADHDLEYFNPNGPNPAIGFRGYEETSVVPDSVANKGVGFARLVSPSGRRFEVFFTHLQASYSSQQWPFGGGNAAFANGVEGWAGWDSDLKIRYEQMRIAGNFAQCLHRDASNVVLFAGDLNIMGDLSNPLTLGSDARLFSEGRFREHNRWEWDSLFNKTHGNDPLDVTFFRTSLEEAWTYQMTPRACHPTWLQPTNPLCLASGELGFLGEASFDRGFTWAEQQSEERLDYVLIGSPVDAANRREFCVQHMSLAWNLNNGNQFEGGISSMTPLGGSEPASDHMGLNAEIDRDARYCNPTDALVDPPSNQELQLARRGAVQWIKLTKPGTYTFNVNAALQDPPGPDSELDFRVYEPTDLSRPVVPYKGEVKVVPPERTCVLQVEIPICTTVPGYTERKFKVMEAPLYIKVFHPGDTYSSSYTGAYRFRYHRNDCASPAEACDLLPYETRENVESHAVQYAATAPPALWFSITVEAADSMLAQRLRLFATEAAGVPQHIENFEVFKEDGITPVTLQVDGQIVPLVGTPTTFDNRQSWVFQDGDGVLDRVGNGNGRDQKYLIKVNRLLGQTQSTEAFSFWVGWETNLTWIYGAERGGASARIWCEESQETGDDEIFMRIEVDGESFPRERTGDPSDRAVLLNGEFDEDEETEWTQPVFQQLGISRWGANIAQQKGLKFVQSAVLELIEDDPSYDEVVGLRVEPLGRQFKPIIYTSGTWHFEGREEPNYINKGFTMAHYSSGKPCGSDSQCNAPMRCVSSVCR